MSPTTSLRSTPGGHPPSPPGALILSVDLGTSGAKVGLVSPEGDVVAAAFEPTSLVLLPGGGAEQDPDDWWRAVTAAARRVIRATGRASDVVAVACTAQWSGTVALDENGRHLAPALIWMDMRGAPLVRERIGGRIRMAGYEVRKAFHWIRLTGGAPEKSGKGPVGHILWLAREQSEVYRAAAVLLEPKDYLNARLTGRPAAGFDSIALHWVTDNRHVDQVSYDPRLIELAGLDRAKLPELRPPTDVLGPLLKGPATELGVREGVPVVMGAPDIHTAAIGSGATADYQAHLYLGTSSWLVCHTPFKKTDVRRNMTCLPSALPGRWMLVNEQETAGACLDFLANSLGVYPDDLSPDAEPADLYAGYDRAAAQAAAGNSGVLFAPWLYGERTPVEDPRLRAGLVNLSLNSSKSDVVRAVFEGVALNSRWLHRSVEAFLRRPVREIRMVGGGARSSVWCQIYADVLGCTVHQVRDPAWANIRGAALLGYLSIGSIGIQDLQRGSTVAQTFRPGHDAVGSYDRLFEEFLRLHRSIRSASRRAARN
jgi:xylulokinase